MKRDETIESNAKKYELWDLVLKLGLLTICYFVR